MEQNTQDASQTATEQAESSTVQTESAATDTEKQESVPKKDFNKVYWQKKEAERKIAELENKLNSQSVQNTPSQKPEQKQETEPQLEDFDYDHDAYTNALVDYRVKNAVEKTFAQTQEQQRRQQQQEEENKLTKSFNERYSDYVAQNDEYRELAEAAGNRVYQQHVNTAIFHDENGPAIDHYLLKNPEIAEKVNAMNPVQATMEIGKISAQITKKLQPKQTNAPAPFETVQGGANASTDDQRYNPNLSMDAYYAAAMAKKGRTG